MTVTARSRQRWASNRRSGSHRSIIKIEINFRLRSECADFRLIDRSTQIMIAGISHGMMARIIYVVISNHDRSLGINTSCYRNSIYHHAGRIGNGSFIRPGRENFLRHVEEVEFRKQGSPSFRHTNVLGDELYLGEFNTVEICRVVPHNDGQKRCGLFRAFFQCHLVLLNRNGRRRGRA